jgi:hypothetical protein
MLIDEVSRRQPRKFHSRFRGYAPGQVDEELTAMDDELRTVRADLEATSRRCEHLTRLVDETRADRDAHARRYRELAQLNDNLNAELKQLRPDHDTRLAQTPAAIRIQHLIETAEDEADLIRRSAIEFSAEMRERSEQLLRQRVELVEQTEQETQRCLAHAAEEASKIVQQAVEQSQLLLKEILDRQNAFDASYATLQSPHFVPAPRTDQPGQAEQDSRPTEVAAEVDSAVSGA